VICVANEDAPEESQRQDAVEALGAGIRLRTREAEEGTSLNSNERRFK
jgi:hypothetical protein